MPSWQARLLNVVTKHTMKPMMRFIGSIESMRSMSTSLDDKQASKLPDDIRAKPVSTLQYDGEWVQIAGKRPRRILLYLPGGGFVTRTPTMHKSFVAKICRQANTKALVVHYRLAPEVPFPGGLEDCVAAYHDLLKQGIEPAAITLAGDSAGGGLVLSTLLALRDEGTPMPANAVVLSPMADLTFTGESRVFNERADPVLPNHRGSDMHQLYMGGALPEDRFASPVLASFEGLPPLLGLVGSTEILLSDTLRAATRAEEAGVPFFLEVWEEMPHNFALMPILPESKVAIERIARFIHNSELDELPAQYGSSRFEPRQKQCRWRPMALMGGGSQGTH
jgi:acetyl esterase/lipase